MINVEEVRDAYKREEILTEAHRTAIFGQLNRFRELPESWDGEGANPINDRTIENSQRLIESAIDILPVPIIDVNPNGTVSFEWQTESGVAYLEVGRTAFGLFVELGGDVVFHVRETVSQPDWRFLWRFGIVAQYLGVSAPSTKWHSFTDWIFNELPERKSWPEQQRYWTAFA